jgi:hypothetical protein
MLIDNRVTIVLDFLNTFYHCIDHGDDVIVWLLWTHTCNFWKYKVAVGCWVQQFEVELILTCAFLSITYHNEQNKFRSMHRSLWKKASSSCVYWPVSLTCPMWEKEIIWTYFKLCLGSSNGSQPLSRLVCPATPVLLSPSILSVSRFFDRENLLVRYLESH